MKKNVIICVIISHKVDYNSIKNVIELWNFKNLLIAVGTFRVNFMKFYLYIYLHHIYSVLILHSILRCIGLIEQINQF